MPGGIQHAGNRVLNQRGRGGKGGRGRRGYARPGDPDFVPAAPYDPASGLTSPDYNPANAPGYNPAVDTRNRRPDEGAELPPDQRPPPNYVWDPGSNSWQPPPAPAPPPAAPPSWQSMIEKFLPVPVPGGSSTLFPEWESDTTPDYQTGPFVTNRNLENRYNTATGTRADYTAGDPREYDQVSNYLYNRLGALDPSKDNNLYDQQLNAWMESAKFEEDRQAAGLKEAYGSRGARYSGDMATAEGLYRQEAGARTRQEAGDIRDRLNRARLLEQEQATTGLTTVGKGRADIQEAGLGRMFESRESAANRGMTIGMHERGLEADQITAERNRTADLTKDERQHMFDAMMRRQEAAGGAYANATNMAWQEYMLSRLPPDVVAQLLGYATSFNPPGSVVTT